MKSLLVDLTFDISYETALEEAYETLLEKYKAEGRDDIFLRALAKARRYLRKWPAPYQYPGTNTWFVGDLDHNTKERNAGTHEYRGFDTQPFSNQCACRDEPFKKGKTLATCACIQVVLLHLETINACKLF